jgi:hypothetical protein
MKRLLILLLAAAPCWAQEAKVLQIDVADAAKARALYDKMQQAERDWEEFRAGVEKKYLTTEDGKEASNVVVSDGSSISWGIAACYLSELNESKEEQERREKACDTWRKEHPAPKSVYYREGWQSGFEFSKDFKFIVPKRALLLNSDGTNPWRAPCVTFSSVTPAIGTIHD